MPYNMELYIF